MMRAAALMSSRGAPSYVYEPSYEDVQQVVGSPRGVATLVRGKRFKFRPLAEPLPCTGISSRFNTGMAFGKLTLKQAKKATGLDEQEILEFFFDHEKYGVEFCAVDSNGNVVQRSAAFDIVGEPEEPEPFEEPKHGLGDGYITKHPNGQIWCDLCEEWLPSRGWAMHYRRNNRHLELKAKRVAAAS